MLSGMDNIILKLRKAGLKDLLEFSRAIHAEMDAVTTAARKGKPVRGSKMYVTTFPCHYCARHLVASGIHEVQYIEPYPKSLAMNLHKDAITSDEIDWIPPGQINEKHAQKDNYQKVLFKPFVGVAPRLYSRAFTKDRPLKNNQTGQFEIGSPVWGNKWGIPRISYVQLEAQLTKVIKDE
jgi:tRNA(Arg) A34 adenosine deaminase TadA